jgi:glucuronate isomerase
MKPMSSIFNDDFLLDSEFAVNLYTEVRDLPIVDYHSHLPVEVISQNRNFSNLTDIWIRGDHYKWRAMRLNGVPEKYCSGTADDFEKFQFWAATLPMTLRNPLYQWSALELKKYFGVHTVLNPETAFPIWEQANAMLAGDDYRPRALLKKMNVEVLCTTDDPADTLEHHAQLKADAFEVAVLPTFRPDAALAISDRQNFSAWLGRLASTTDIDINNFDALLSALRMRHDAFAKAGCRMSDHGLERCFVEPCRKADMRHIFNKYLHNVDIESLDVERWRSFLMLEFARWNHDKGWTMLLHLGAARNNNLHVLHSIGRDAGCDSIGDYKQAYRLNRFLSLLDAEGQLPRTVLFNSNPVDNLLFATVTGNFFEDSVACKIQFGPAWWFLDTAQGICDQLNALSQVGLFSRFIGMVTDSRSFMSFSRHDYFRRVVCNMLGEDVRRRLIPDDMAKLVPILQGIFYQNACQYVRKCS